MLLTGRNFMFTLSCSTCEAKLVVKDEELIGKIFACPSCGSMVLVQPPDIAPISQDALAKKPATHKRFPDVLSHGTNSGIIGQVPEGNRRTDLFLEAVQNSGMSNKEIQTRKILIAILICLSVLFLVALGFLMLYQKPTLSQPPIPELNIQVPAAPPQIEPPQVEPELENDNDIALPIVSEFENVVSDTSLNSGDAVSGSSADTLFILNDKMSGFVDITIPSINIDEKLALPILELNFSRKSLISFVRMMSQLTEIPMTLDIDEMKARSLSVNTPVSGQFSEATVEKILTETLATLELQWIAIDRQILIRPKETADETDLTFDVSDFAEKTEDLTPEVLADMIRKLVIPEGNVKVLSDNRLTVVQNEPSGKSSKRLREDILRFLEQLRAVRQLPLKTEWSGETLAPEAFGWDQVLEPITLNYYRAVPLSRIVTQLESLTKLTILVDHQSLHRSLCSFASVQAAVQCDNGTVNDAMELLLSSADSAALVYRIVDHQTLEITTAESSRQPDKMIVEVHRYQLQGDETWDEIVRLLRSAIAPESWAVAELPETKSGGTIVVDKPSQCLLVRQSQPAQRRIRLYLSEPQLLAP
jgi:DNA-directed RNA polymerase subunit RPC12/RpoP